MLITVDIGNSLIKIGFFRGERLIVRNMDISSATSLSTLRRVISGVNLDKTAQGCIICSVVPEATDVVIKALRDAFGIKPILVRASLVKSLRFDIRNPERLGADRVASAVGANFIYGAPCVVVDLGTATTLGFIGKGGIFKGGAIMPGVGLMAEALSTKTAKLPFVKPQRSPDRAVGKDTRESILSGIIYGTAGAVQRIIKEAEKISSERYKVILTGGHSGLLADYLSHDAVEPSLTLKGMRFIYQELKDART